MAGGDHSATGATRQQSTGALLATAADQLERVDLENDRELADEVVKAVEATDEAAELAADENALPEQSGPAVR